MSAEIRVGGVGVSNPDKVWWPDDGITKLDLVRWYDAAADAMRPYLEDRPLSAERCPDGMRGDCFFQKDFSRGLPAGVPTAPVHAPSARRTVRYVLGGPKRSLLALANLGSIAIHVMNARVDDLDRPDWMAFDLDPTSGEFGDAARVGAAVRGVLDEVGLRSYPKTSGSRGLHVLVPLRRGPSQRDVRAFAVAVAKAVERREPLATTEFSKAERRGRVLVDVMRNGTAQTIVPPYSARRRAHATVSAPLAWDEARPTLDPARFTIRSMPRRMAAGDPWDGFWRARRALPDLARVSGNA